MRCWNLSGNQPCLTLLAALVVAAGSLSGCGGESDGVGPPMGPPTVTAAQPLRKQIVEWDAYTGRLQAVDSVEIQAKVSGYLDQIHFIDGQLVNEGDLLFTIQQRPFLSEVQRAEAALSEAEANKKRAEAGVREATAALDQAKAAYVLAEVREGRAQRLENRGAVAQEELDQRLSEKRQAAADVEAASAAIELAKAQVDVAAAEVDSAASSLQTANIQLGYSTIESPITGRVSRRNVSVGNLITGGAAGSTVLTTVVSVDPIYVYFNANEQEYRKYVRLDNAGKRESSRSAKNPIRIGLIDDDAFPYEGHMDFVENRFDDNTGTITGRGVLPNADGDLLSGLFARIRIPGSAPYEATLVPDEAIGTDQTEQFVYVVTKGVPAGPPGGGEQSDESGDEPKDSKDNEKKKPAKKTTIVERRTVEPGPKIMGLRVIRTGLEGGEQVVIRGLGMLRPGSEVNVEKGEIVAEEESKLPNSYEPWPRDRWLGPSSKTPTAGDPVDAMPNSTGEPVRPPQDPESSGAE